MSNHTQIFEWLKALALNQIAVTAAIDEAGTLNRISGLGAKLKVVETAPATLGLQLVGVADDQDDVLAEFLKPDHQPFRVLKARTLIELVGNLYEDHGPRAVVRQFEAEVCGHIDLMGKGLLPIETHYQALPLLHAVESELSERGPRETGQLAEKTQGLDEQELLSREVQAEQERITIDVETSLEELFADFRHVVKNAQSDVPRFAVLGPPGSGKSTLVNNLSWLAARGKLLLSGRKLLPARMSLGEWENYKVKNPTIGLPEFLAEKHKERSPAPPDEDHWRRWLQLGDVLLLLDGLDEIHGDKSFLADLTSALNHDFTKCPTVITCRTDSFEQHEKACPGFPRFILRGLTDEQRDEFVRNYPAENPARFQAQELIGELHRVRQMHLLVATPLLLSIICYVVDDPKEKVELPITRVKLYDRAVRKLMAHYEGRLDTSYPSDPPDVAQKREILERTSLYLLLSDRAAMRFEAKELRLALNQALRDLDYPAGATPWANAFTKDLTRNSGLLRWKGETGSFRHRTIQEFLAAAALARLANDEGQEAVVQVSGRKRTVRELVGKKAWDPAWRDVICMLAGKLQKPGWLLELLADVAADDLFRHRLVLACLCLPEIARPTREANETQVDAILKAVFDFWNSQAYRRLLGVPFLQQVGPALPQLDITFKGTPLLTWCCQRLREPAEPGRRYWAVNVLEAIGESAAQPQIAQALADVVSNEQEETPIRIAAVRALGRMASMVVEVPRVLDALVVALRGPISLAWDAAETLARIGPRAALNQDVIPTLLRALLNGKDEFCVPFAEALGRLGEAAAKHEAVLPNLVMALENPHRDVRSGALGALRAFRPWVARHADLLPHMAYRLLSLDYWGWNLLEEMPAEAAEHPGFVPILLELCHDESDLVRWRAMYVLASLGEHVAGNSDVVRTLLHAAVRDADDTVRDRASSTLQDLGVRIWAWDWFLPTILAGLQEQAAETFTAAATLLQTLAAPASLTAEVRETLARRLRNDDDAEEVHEAAANALAVFADQAVEDPEVLDALLIGLADESLGCRFECKYALQAVTPALLQAIVVPAVLARLSDEVSQVRKRALQGLEYLAEHVRQNHRIVDKVLPLLRDPDSEIRALAASVLSESAPPQTQRDAVLAGLRERLTDEDANVRQQAAWSLLGLDHQLDKDPQILLALLSCLGADPHGPFARAVSIVKTIADIPAALPEIIDGLLSILDSANAEHRSLAVALLRRFVDASGRHPRVLPRLVDLLLQHANDRTSIMSALQEFGLRTTYDGRILSAFVHVAIHDSEMLYWAPNALAEIVARQPHEILRVLTGLEPANQDVRERFAKEWGEETLDHPAGFVALVRALRDPHRVVREAASAALKDVQSYWYYTEERMLTLVGLLHHEEREVRYRAAGLLARIGDEAPRTNLVPALIQALKDADPRVRDRVASALEAITKNVKLDDVIKAAAERAEMLRILIDCVLRSQDLSVRHWAGKVVAEAAGKMTHPTELLALLQAALHDPDRNVRYRAATLSGKLTPCLANHPGIVTALVRIVDNLGANSDISPAQALRAQGEAGLSTPGVLPGLVEILQQYSGRFRRKAVIALGLLGSAAADHETIPALALALHTDPSWEVREAVGWALGRVDDNANPHPDTIPALLTAHQDDAWQVRAESIRALSCFPDRVLALPETIDQWCAFLGDKEEHASVRVTAAWALAQLGDSLQASANVLAGFTSALASDKGAVRFSACVALAQLSPTIAGNAEVLSLLLDCAFRWAALMNSVADVLERLPDALFCPPIVSKLQTVVSNQDEKWNLRASALFLLARAGSTAGADASVLAALGKVLAEQDPGLRLRAYLALGRSADPRGLDLVQHAIDKEGHPLLRAAARWSLVRLGGAGNAPLAAQEIAEFLNDPAGPIRGEAAHALGLMGSQHCPAESLSGLAKLLNDDEDRQVRFCAAWSLASLARVASDCAPVIQSVFAAVDASEPLIRWWAVWNLAQMKHTGPQFLNVLRERYAREEDAEVRSLLEMQLHRLGDFLVPKDIYASLAETLEHRDTNVSYAAGRALSSFLAAGWRIFASANGTVTLESVDELCRLEGDRKP